MSDPNVANMGQAAVSLAMGWEGTPYLWGGSGKGGIDCSGLVQAVYGKLGIQLPRTTYQQVNTGTPVASIDQAQPGDLIFLHPDSAGPGHVGIYVGGGMMIDANHTGGSVGIRAIAGYGAIVAIRRVANGAAPAGAGGAQVNLPQDNVEDRKSLAYQMGNFVRILQSSSISPAMAQQGGPLGTPPNPIIEPPSGGGQVAP